MADFNRLPEIIRELETAVDKATREAVEEILIPAARAKLKADDWHLQHLAEALHADVQLEGVYVVAGGRTANGEDVWWGHLVEHGAAGPRETRNRQATGGRASHPSGAMAARPFLTPALEETREAIIERVAEAVRRST